MSKSRTRISERRCGNFIVVRHGWGIEVRTVAGAWRVGLGEELPVGGMLCAAYDSGDDVLLGRVLSVYYMFSSTAFDVPFSAAVLPMVRQMHRRLSGGGLRYGSAGELVRDSLAVLAAINVGVAGDAVLREGVSSLLEEHYSRNRDSYGDVGEDFDMEAYRRFREGLEALSGGIGDGAGD